MEKKRIGKNNGKKGIHILPNKRRKKREFINVKNGEKSRKREIKSVLTGRKNHYPGRFFFFFFIFSIFADS